MGCMQLFNGCGDRWQITWPHKSRAKAQCRLGTFPTPHDLPMMLSHPLQPVTQAGSSNNGNGNNNNYTHSRWDSWTLDSLELLERAELDVADSSVPRVERGDCFAAAEVPNL